MPPPFFIAAIRPTRVREANISFLFPPLALEFIIKMKTSALFLVRLGFCIFTLLSLFENWIAWK
jgi:hypothetical protein